MEWGWGGADINVLSLIVFVQGGVDIYVVPLLVLCTAVFKFFLRVCEKLLLMQPRIRSLDR